MQGSRVLEDLLNNRDKRGFALEGGSRSTKTWSIIQFLLLYCQGNTGKEITVGRDRLTWNKVTVFRDFKSILTAQGWWNDSKFHKQEMTYELFKNQFTFVGFDDPAKFHGLKQNVFWMNEAIGTPGSAFSPTVETFDQLEMRTTDFWLLDYNPKVMKHWIYEKVIPRDDVKFIHSTQLDNPFLELPIRKKILSYEPTDENIKRGTADSVKWSIYGLGKRAQHEGVVIKKINYVKVIPDQAKFLGYGLDFGYSNDVTALTKIYLHLGEIYLKKVVYETGLLNSDLNKLMVEAGVKKRSDVIVADSADPKSIAELQSWGWNVEAAMKGQDSIRNGLDGMNRYTFNILETDLEFKDEAEGYVYKEDRLTGKYLNEPVDAFNHMWDGVRYFFLNKLLKTQAIAPSTKAISSRRG